MRPRYQPLVPSPRPPSHDQHAHPFERPPAPALQAEASHAEEPYHVDIADCGTRIVDQIVVENGTAPLADLYFSLKDRSSNRGEVDHGALIGGRPQTFRTNWPGQFQLFRIGDAIASRNVHAAIYDALRLLKDI